LRVKVLGSGSIGNHLSNASRRLGWAVDMTDVDPAALKRTREMIYPQRYGAWDDAIRQFEAKDAPQGGYDLICIGTPPDSHINLAMTALDEKPGAVLVEKPFCQPDLDGAQKLADKAAALGVPIFIGYDHVVGRAASTFVEKARVAIGALQTLDVEFREFWGGIFAAHPWLDGPADSYLGYWKRGGGASGEHSHAANLWQHFAHALGAGSVTRVSGQLDMVREAPLDYDRLCLLTLATAGGLLGRVVQDVVTAPPRKWARAQGTDGWVEWHCGYRPGADAVLVGTAKGVAEEIIIEKTRPEDFIAELTHIADALKGDPSASPISMARGLDTMLVVAAAHKSNDSGRTIALDYSKGWTPAALVAA